MEGFTSTVKHPKEQVLRESCKQNYVPAKSILCSIALGFDKSWKHRSFSNQTNAQLNACNQRNPYPNLSADYFLPIE